MTARYSDCMNGNVPLVLEEIALSVGGLARCEVCNELASTHDPIAERRAYAKATNDWKNGAFGDMKREEVLALMERVVNRGDCSCAARLRD